MVEKKIKHRSSKEIKLESDTAFAQVVATQLDNLINAGVLTREAVSSASAETIDEFIARYDSSIIHSRFDPIYYPKIRTQFGIPDTRETKVVERESKRAEIVTSMRSLLFELQELFLKSEDTPFVVGVILFGSNMDEEKRHRSKQVDVSANEVAEASDIDAIFIARHLPGSEYLSKDNSIKVFDSVKTLQHGHLPEGYSVDEQEWCVNSERNLLYVLHGKEQYRSYPIWGWKPSSVMFIGELNGYSEEKVNELIQQYLRSDLTQQAKKRVIDFVRIETTRQALSS